MGIMTQITWFEAPGRHVQHCFWWMGKSFAHTALLFSFLVYCLCTPRTVAWVYCKAGFCLPGVNGIPVSVFLAFDGKGNRTEVHDGVWDLVVDTPGGYGAAFHP
jgi:hypothetical protein